MDGRGFSTSGDAVEVGVDLAAGSALERLAETFDIADWLVEKDALDSRHWKEDRCWAECRLIAVGDGVDPIVEARQVNTSDDQARIGQRFEDPPIFFVGVGEVSDDE